MGDAHRIDAGGFLAHERARGAGDAMNDGNIAGHQVRELRQKQCRPQIVHQPLVEEGGGSIAPAQSGQDRGIDCRVALAAAGGDDHVHARQQFGIAFDAGAVEGEPRRIGANALPSLHLALVAFLGNLLVEVERGDRMNDEGRPGHCIGRSRRRVETLPMRLRPFAEARDDAHARDPSLSRRISRRITHWPATPSGRRARPRPFPCAGGIPGSGIQRHGT